MKKDLIFEAIANYCIVNGCASTISSNRIFQISDLEEHFELEPGFILKHAADIKNYFNSEIVSEGDIYRDPLNGEEVVDLTFFGNYCNVDVEFDC